MYQVNPMQLIQMIKNGQNPQQLVMSILQGPMSNTPMGQNLLSLAQTQNTSGLEQFARNVSQQRGIDYDKEFAAFCQMLGIK